MLNDKRDVNVIVSANDEDSTLGGVSVGIHDHLNDLWYIFGGENLEAGETYEIGGGADVVPVTLKQVFVGGDPMAGASIRSFDEEGKPVALRSNTTQTFTLYCYYIKTGNSYAFYPLVCGLSLPNSLVTNYTISISSNSGTAKFGYEGVSGTRQGLINVTGITESNIEGLEVTLTFTKNGG